MRTILIALLLVGLLVDPGVSIDSGAMAGVSQNRRIAQKPERNIGSMGDFIISANAKAILDPHHLRRIVVYVAPSVFTLANVRTIFLHLSEEYPSEDFLLIDAVSNTRELHKRAGWFATIKSFPFGDVAPLSCGTEVEPPALSAQYCRAAVGEYINYSSASAESIVVYLKHLSYGCNDPNDSAPDLVGATISNCKEVVERLLDSGVDPNVKSPQGWAPVFEAAYWNQEEILKVLLDRGADINQRSSSGWTPLIAAANRDRSTIVESLLRRGADINARNEEGRTALIYAVGHQNAAVVKVLLAYGADVNAKDGYGKTAIMIAKEGHDENMIHLLKEAGAARSGRKLSHHFNPKLSHLSA